MTDAATSAAILDLLGRLSPGARGLFLEAALAEARKPVLVRLLEAIQRRKVQP